MQLKVVGVHDPILRQKAKPVAKLDKKILGLIADMANTLADQKDPEGVGLAAPQVGKSIQLFITDYKGFKRVIINPKLVTISKAKPRIQRAKGKSRRDILEGCLSLPHYYGPIKRAPEITLRYLNEKGREITEKFTDFQAQIIQHELDHLNGILFVDHILSQKAPLYRFKGKEWEEVELI